MHNLFSTLARMSLVILLFFNIHSVALALPLAELKKYDRNGNNQIDAGFEEEVYLLHLQNQVMRKFDVNPVNGKLDPVEVIAIENASDVKLGNAYNEDQVDEARLDLNFGESRVLEVIADPVSPKAKKKDAAQKFFLRKNRLNISVYNQSIDKSAADGAEFDLSWNETTGENKFSAKGVASYVLGRNTKVPRPQSNQPNDLFLSAYALAAWTEFDYQGSNSGSSSRDKLIFGLDNQFELFGGNVFGAQVLNFSPSYQTDFDLDARIYSAEASWQPYNTEIALGSYQTIANTPFAFTWLAQADTLYQHVDHAGKTKLKENSSYWWVGGEIDATLWIYPEELERKLYAKLNVPYHYDLNSGAEAWNISTSLNYNLDQQGITALSFGYENGEDFKTGTELEQFTFGLKAKY